MSLLEGILSAEDCRQCKFCCVFDKTDIWEYPFAPSTAEYDCDGLFRCAALTEKGCSLGTQKPFDCQIWPFRAVRLKSGEIAVTLSPYCKKVFSLPLQEIYSFYNDNLHDKIMYAVQNSDIKIVDYEKGYPVMEIFS